MTHTTPGAAPDVMYEPSFCNRALLDAGLDVVPPATLSSLARTWPTMEDVRRQQAQEAMKEAAERRARENAFRIAIAPRIRERRKQLGMTQADLAAATGVIEASIGHYENGRQLPPYHVALRLAKVLGFDDTANVATRRGERAA